MVEFQRVLEAIRVSLKSPQRILNRIYSLDMEPRYGIMTDGSYIGREDYEQDLEKAVLEAGRRIGLYLECLRLGKSREEFLSGWRDLSPDYGKTEYLTYGEEIELHSKAIDYLNEVYSTLSLMSKTDTEKPLLEKENSKQETLEYTLSATAQILKNAGVKPASEAEIQRVMDNHLATVFPDYVRTVTLAKPIASFKPDGGVVSLHSAIEYKYCDSLAALKTAFRGITEDLSGYTGSRDWTRFYGVVYQTEAFVSPERFSRSLKLSGNSEKWTVMLITSGRGEK